HLILHGVPRRTMYAELARLWDAPLIELHGRRPPAAALMARREPRDFALAGWVPWRLDGEVLTIATSVPPTPDVLADARALAGVDRVEVRTATDWDVNRTVQEVCRDKLLYRITDQMADTAPDASARVSVAVWQKVVPPVLLVAFLVTAVLRPGWAVVVVYSAANLLFVNNIAFKTLYGLRSPWRIAQKRRWERAVRRERERRGLRGDWPGRVPDDRLPVYTILVPVYDEVEVVAKVIGNLDRLDYPKSKLDVLILLEQDDTATIEAAQASRPPEYVRIVIVPEGRPRTKPRACNYGLEFAKGEYVVIFDAEDRPQPDQLRRAVAAFEVNRLVKGWVDPTAPRLVCVQASLMYFNSDYNLLTRMFSIEYAHWFDMMLPGMDGSGLPLPLGGTSNHFETEVLRRLGAWDPYNVTEDADLGLRIASQGYAVGTIESATGEEAVSESFAWIRQRTRWIKGYLVTAAVNTRNPARWFRLNGIGGVVGMVGLVLGTPLAFLAYPLALLFTVVTYIGIRVGVDFPTPILQGGLLLMLGGNGAMIVFSGVAAWRRYNWRIAVYAVLDPVYWLMHSAAAWRAAYQLVFDPHRWEKTP
ncbi:glycosyltransferase, partial [Actinosynnema sp. NPDC023658]|uniref:glycosyltransferase n=1 Tax=Actinosynnema sp. NPDC023658 TaxID=3155465 RepID=UPI00340FB59C